jgi:hypothetical protein
MKSFTGFTSTNKRWPAGCLLFLFLLSACHLPEKRKATVPAAYIQEVTNRLNKAKTLIQSGDIIFRNGTDEVSAAARSMNRTDTSFSHCGLLFIEHDSVLVYHALGGSYNPDMKLVREPVENFCNPRDINSFGIYRYTLNPEQLTVLEETVRQHYANGLRFDMYFNYDSDEQMYCSEFVFKSLNRSLGGKLTPYVRLDTIPFGVTTDDIYLNPACRLVKKENFIP